MKTTKRVFVLVMLIGGLSGTTACSHDGSADGEITRAGVDPVYRFYGRLALKGFDPVAYFNDGEAIRGSATIAYEWNDAIWYFASENNRDLFMRAPEMYAPQYGGYCSWAVSHGYTARGDPEAWKIVDGRLYLNYNKDVREMWSKDVAGNIKKGDENWPQFLIKKPEHKGE